MSIRLYRWLLRLFPTRYRATFGREMSVVYEQALAEASARGTVRYAFFCTREFAGLLIAAFRERAWPAYPVQTLAAGTAARTLDGVPAFCICESFLPRRSALVQGGILSLLAFFGLCLAIGHGRVAYRLIIGSYGRNHSGLPEAGTPPAASAGLTTEVKLKPEPGQDPWSDYASVYFRVILVLAVLDANHDHVISSSEIANAPRALRTLDRDHDGKLTAAECGQGFTDNPTVSARIEAAMDPQLLQLGRLAFMRLHPVLAALDANHDGEISASEIQNAVAALKTLDKNGDGKLIPGELFPDPLSNAVAHFMPIMRDGKISRKEWSRKFPSRYHQLFEAADQNKDGIVTGEEMTNEIRRRTDLNNDGIITQQEVRDAFRSGVFERPR